MGEVEDRFKDLEVRMRKVEDFILSQLNTLLEMGRDHKDRLDYLEEEDKSFKAFINQTCSLKEKEIQKAREDAIEISCRHADKNHVQTWKILTFVATIIVGCVVYFNIENNSRALDIKKHETQIDVITKTLDKIDGKMDKLVNHVASGDV